MLNISFLPYKTNPVNFKGHNGYTEVKTGGAIKDVNNYTEFMRNYETLKFTSDYIVKNFPNGTNIAEFGCSLGQKPYSLMLILEEHNKNKKYKITGYDFPEVIEKTKLNLFNISEHSKHEQILFSEYLTPNVYNYNPATTKDAKKIQEAFKKYFVYQPNQYEIVNGYPALGAKTIFAADTKKTKDIVSFKPGDIRNIDRLLKPKENGVVIFQNALYHILSHTLAYDIEDMIHVDEAKEVFKKVNKVLPKDGIFVIGNLSCDHIFDSEKEDESHLAYQDNKLIRVFDTSPVHKALRESGFKPVFYEQLPERTAYGQYKKMNVPSVWKKVNDL